MCIAVFMWKCDPMYPFLLLLNRDEYHNRPTRSLGWWEGKWCEILGGRDEKAGGTWLACTKSGKLSFLTNVREIQSSSNKTTRSRGDLPLRFFQSGKSPIEFADELAAESEQDHYNGFNLIVADLRSMSMLYITNRPPPPHHHHHVHKNNTTPSIPLITTHVTVQVVSPGIHVLSNAQLDTPWPKAERLRHSFADVVRKYCDDEAIILSMQEITQKIMYDNTKDDDETKLPHIYPLEFEYLLSSIFVEAADTPLGRYGTRSTSGVVLRRNGEISFYERSLVEKVMWKEQTVTYDI